VAAAQEERFTRRKHDGAFPLHAIAFVLRQAGLPPTAIGAVALLGHADARADGAWQLALASREGGGELAALARPVAGIESRLQADLYAVLGRVPPLVAVPRHWAHAGSAHEPSGLDAAAVLVIDGAGDGVPCAIGHATADALALTRRWPEPAGLGALYTACTAYAGFRPHGGEYKLMGLAPYGRPRFVRHLLDRLVSVDEDGGHRLTPLAVAWASSLSGPPDALHDVFDGPPRTPESAIAQRDVDLAASIQQVTGDIVVRLAGSALSATGERDLVLGGGVALNCVANGRVRRETPVRRLVVQPAAGDAGGALGAALLVSRCALGVPRDAVAVQRSFNGGRLGPSPAADEIGAMLSAVGAPHEQIVDPDARAHAIARALADSAVVGFCSGRMEFGPRALGARSILADPRRADMQRRLNLAIKFRESFRPFAPAVLAERAADWFEIEGDSPYMLATMPVLPRRRLGAGDVASPNGGSGAPQASPPYGDGEPSFPSRTDQPSDTARPELDVLATLHQVRSEIPAVTHVDFSARVQTVGPGANPEFRRLLEAFGSLTGCPVLVNTSFNVRGEPIVCTPADAWQCFLRTGIDLLVLEDRLVWKDRLPPDLLRAAAADAERARAAAVLD